MNKAIILTGIPVKKSFEKKFWVYFIKVILEKRIKVFLFNDIALNCGEIFIFTPRDFKKLENHTLIENAYSFLIDEYIKDYMIYKTIVSECCFCEIEENVSYIIENLVEVFENNNVLAVIAWSELTPGSFLSRWLIRKLDYRAGFYEAERAPLDNYIWIEKNGIFDKSKLWHKDFPNLNEKYILKGEKEFDNLRNNVYGFRKQLNDEDEQINDFENNIFFPFDNIYEVGWFPNIVKCETMNYCKLYDPKSFIYSIKTRCFELGYELTIRKHPSCKYIKDVNRQNLKKLIEKSKFCMCNYTKVAFPIISLNKPLITFVKNPVLLIGKAIYIESAKQLTSKVIEDAYKAAECSMEIACNRLGWMVYECFYSIESQIEQKRLEEFICKIIVEE